MKANKLLSKQIIEYLWMEIQTQNVKKELISKKQWRHPR